MNTNNRSLDIFTEEEVFNYVAGNLDEQHLARFEAKLVDNPDLQAAVENERLLRQQLLDIDAEQSQESPISENNLSLLLDKIDEQEKQLADDQQAWPAKNSRWAGLTAIAASAALVAVLVVNFNPSQDYYLRSSPPETAQPDYQTLVESNRVAQIWVTDSLKGEEIASLLKQFDLVPISKSGDAWLATSKNRLSTQQLNELQNNPKIARAALVSHESN